MVLSRKAFSILVGFHLALENVVVNAGFVELIYLGLLFLGGGFVAIPAFMPDGHHAIVGYRNGAVELWRIDASLDELLDWTEANRYIPELSCEQRLFYGVEPLCEVEE